MLAMYSGRQRRSARPHNLARCCGQEATNVGTNPSLWPAWGAGTRKSNDVSESGAAGLGGPAGGLCGKRARQKAHRIHALLQLGSNILHRDLPDIRCRHQWPLASDYAAGRPIQNI